MPPFCLEVHGQGLVRNPVFVPREPPGQTMAVSRGNRPRRALRRPHLPHPVSPVSSHVVQPYPRGPPAYEATLLDIKKHSQHQSVAEKSRSEWAVRLVLLHKINRSRTRTYFSSSNIHDQCARNLFDLMTNQLRAQLFSVPGSKRSDAFWEELRHPLGMSTRLYPWGWR